MMFLKTSLERAFLLPLVFQFLQLCNLSVETVKGGARKQDGEGELEDKGFVSPQRGVAT